MLSKIKEFLEFLWLYFKGFRPVEFMRDDDRLSLHPCGWRANGSGKLRRAKDAVAYLEGNAPEQWRQIYCGMTPFLVSDRGNVRLIDGSEPQLFLSNGRYQVPYKPDDDSRPKRGKRGGAAHKKRVYRSVLVAMAFLDFKKGDTEHEVHHVNGYRTDDRLVNLMVVTHDEHTRIHAMGPCGLTAPMDEKIAESGLMAECRPMRKRARKRVANAPLPTIDDTGTFTAPALPEGVTPEALLAAAQAESAPVANPPAPEPDPEPMPEPEPEPARGGHAAEGPSTLEAAADAGREAAKALESEGAAIRSGAYAQENLANGLSRSAKRRSAKRRAAARAEAQAKAAAASAREATPGEVRPEDRVAASAASTAATSPDAAPAESEQAPTETTPAAPRGPKAKSESRQKPEPEADSAMHSAGDAGATRPGAEQNPQPAPAGVAEAASAPDQAAGTKPDAHGPEPADWPARRAAVDAAIDAYLDRVRQLVRDDKATSKRCSAVARPFYRAFKPFYECPDAVAKFDASLSCIRTLAEATTAGKEQGLEFPQSTHSMAGTMLRMLKDSVTELAREADPVVLSCVDELLRAETQKPVYDSFGRKTFKQCIDIAAPRS